MTYFLVGDCRPLSLDGGSVEAWNWKTKRMEAAPEMLLAVTMGMDDDFEPMDIEEISAIRFVEVCANLSSRD